MSDPRIAIIGAGSLSSRRIYPYIGVAGGQIVGVCDLDRKKAERNARRFGGTVYTDLETMLDREKPDGVIICVGPEGHAELAPAVLEKGYPVYTEKPPAPTAYAVSLQFASGAVGSLSLNCGRSFRIPTEEIEISVRGGNFMTVHNSSAWRITENQQPCEWREPPTFTSAGDSGNDTGHLSEIADFLAAIQEGRTTRSNIYESYKSMVLYEAIKTSAETGKIVDVIYQSL